MPAAALLWLESGGRTEDLCRPIPVRPCTPGALRAARQGRDESSLWSVASCCWRSSCAPEGTAGPPRNTTGWFPRPSRLRRWRRAGWRRTRRTVPTSARQVP